MSIIEKLGSMGIPGFRSGKKWKMGLAIIVYICLFFVILGAIVTVVTVVEEYTRPPPPPIAKATKTCDELFAASIEERIEAAGRGGRGQGSILSAHYYPESKEANVSVELVAIHRSIIKEMFVRNAVWIADATFLAGLDIEKISITSWDRGCLESNVILKAIVTRETHNKIDYYNLSYEDAIKKWEYYKYEDYIYEDDQNEDKRQEKWRYEDYIYEEDEEDEEDKRQEKRKYEDQRYEDQRYEDSR